MYFAQTFQHLPYSVITEQFLTYINDVMSKYNNTTIDRYYVVVVTLCALLTFTYFLVLF